MIPNYVSKRGQEAMSRDPRQFRYGYLSEGVFSLDLTRVFMWFSSPKELIGHICECDPIIHELDPEKVQPFGARVRKIVGDPVVLSDDKLQQVNDAAKAFLCIEWWGTFDELRTDSSEVATDIRRCLREDGADGPVIESELDQFVELIQTYGF